MRPYPLSVTVPAMVLEHLLLFGVVEALLTGLVVYHLHGSRSAWVLRARASEVVPMKEYRPLWFALLVMALLSPLGLYLPEWLRAGAAGASGASTRSRRWSGMPPQAWRSCSDLWKAPIPDYALPGQEGAPLAHRSLSYLLSAFVGVGLCGGSTYVLTRWLTKGNR